MYTDAFRIITPEENQKEYWDNQYNQKNEMFGFSPSKSAKYAVKVFKKSNVHSILELGAGQGRDTIYSLENGFDVTVVDYSRTGLTAIEKKIKKLKLPGRIHFVHHDLKKPLLYKTETFDACYSHMLYCMEFTTKEIIALNTEVNRVLKSDGLNLFTVRNTDDIQYGTGIHHGESIYENGGFIVHFFNKEKIKKISNGYEIIDISEFEEGSLPRKLYQVLLKKNA